MLFLTVHYMRMSSKYVHVALVLLIKTCICLGDPCTDSLELDRSEYRGARCPFKPYKGLCDKRLPQGWYKTSDNSNLVTTIPNQFYCTTVFPIWMNGTFPDSGDGIVNRTACVDYGREDHCEEKLDINIKNCTGYYVYYLTPPSACDAAYCFGETKECPPLDPCDHYFHNTFQCSKDSIKEVCNPLITNGWYKVEGENVSTIPNTCLENTNCRASFPLWMNGTYPQVTDGIVERQVCVSGETCCDKTYTIAMKNCSSVVVYNLLNNTECLGRYCYENSFQNCTLDIGNYQNRHQQKLYTVVTLMIVSIFLMYN